MKRDLDIVRSLLIAAELADAFWSSVELTGNQTLTRRERGREAFWSSVELTGNQTKRLMDNSTRMFWSSVELTGNQTVLSRAVRPCRMTVFYARKIWPGRRVRT